MIGDRLFFLILQRSRDRERNLAQTWQRAALPLALAYQRCWNTGSAPGVACYDRQSTEPNVTEWMCDRGVRGEREWSCARTVRVFFLRDCLDCALHASSVSVQRGSSDEVACTVKIAYLGEE